MTGGEVLGTSPVTPLFEHNRHVATNHGKNLIIR